MYISRENPGRTIVLQRAVEELNVMLSENTIQKKEAYGVLRRLMKELKSLDDGIVYSFPRIEEDAFIRTEDIDELVRAANYNYSYYSAEIEAMNAIGAMVGALIDDKIDSATAACQRAADAIGNLKIYALYKASNPNALVLSIDELNGEANIIDDYLVCKISSSNACNASPYSLETNGLVGNNLEILSDVTLGSPLSPEEIKFIDEENLYQNEENLTDRDRETLFETELYRIPTEIRARLIPITIQKRISSRDIVKITQDEMEDINETSELVDINWLMTEGELFCTITMMSDSPISMVEIMPKITSSFQRIDFAQVSVDGRIWHTIGGPTILAPNTSTYINDGKTHRGNVVYLSHINDAKHLRIRVSQDTPYDTVAIHAAFRHPTEALWLAGPSWNMSIDDKKDFFKEEAVRMADSDVEMAQKFIYAMPVERWSTSLRDIQVTTNTYEKSSEVETELIKFGKPISRVSIIADEVIINDTNIEYYISHDEEAWIQIYPIERVEGEEVIVYSSSGYINEEIPGAKYVAVETLPTKLRLKAIFKGDGTKTPKLRNIVLNPVLSGA